jgi:hypothetical protein
MKCRSIKYWEVIAGASRFCEWKVSAVAFSYNDQHLDVDDNKADKLPDQASSEKLHESSWYHCSKTWLIRFDIFFNCFHIFSFFLTFVAGVDTPIFYYSGIRVQPGLSFAL